MSSNTTNMPDIDGFSYPKALIQLTRYLSGTLTLLRNDTFMLAQIFDSK